LEQAAKALLNQLAILTGIQDIKAIQVVLETLLPMVVVVDLVTEEIKAIQEPQAAVYN